MIRELADTAVKAYFETLARQLCFDDPEKFPLVLEGLITALSGKVRFYRYKAIDVRDSPPDILTGALCFMGRKGWRLITIANDKAIFEMDYFQEETIPKEQGEKEPDWAVQTLIGEQNEEPEV